VHRSNRKSRAVLRRQRPKTRLRGSKEKGITPPSARPNRISNRLAQSYWAGAAGRAVQKTGPDVFESTPAFHGNTMSTAYSGRPRSTPVSQAILGISSGRPRRPRQMKAAPEAPARKAAPRSLVPYVRPRMNQHPGNGQGNCGQHMRTDMTVAIGNRHVSTLYSGSQTMAILLGSLRLSRI